MSQGSLDFEDRMVEVELKELANNVTMVTSGDWSYYIDSTPSVPYRGFCPGDKVQCTNFIANWGRGVVLGRLLCMHAYDEADDCTHNHGQHPESNPSNAQICVLLDSARERERFAIFENYGYPPDERCLTKVIE
jgi:hypothetical protein